MKVLVKSDVYDICNRIKKFDASYRVVFNINSCKYEIYSTRLTQIAEVVSGVVLSYVCCLPYKELDERAIKYLYDTSVNNLEEIVKQIDKQNERIEHQNKTTAIHNSLLLVEDKLRQLI